MMHFLNYTVLSRKINGSLIKTSMTHCYHGSTFHFLIFTFIFLSITEFYSSIIERYCQYLLHEKALMSHGASLPYIRFSKWHIKTNVAVTYRKHYQKIWFIIKSSTVLHDIISGINEITIVDLRESADQCIVYQKGNGMKL